MTSLPIAPTSPVRPPFRWAAVILFVIITTISIAFLWNNLPELLFPFSPLFITIWLFILTVGYFMAHIRHLQQAHATLLATHNDLTQQHLALAAQHRQLEITHELTLYLHSNASQSVQQQLLKAVTKELGFERALIGLINPTQPHVNHWQALPELPQPLPPLPLTPPGNIIVQAVLSQQVRWYLPLTTPIITEPPLLNETVAFFDLTPDENKIDFLNDDGWLILPLVWQKQTVGVLLVMIDTVTPLNLADKRWAVLTSLVSQAAVSLGTIDRTRRLTIEEERNRIARDIHDTVAQSLFGIVFSLEACVKMLPQHVEMVQDELIELRYIAQQTRQEVRQSILDIWPSELTADKFKTDLNKYVATCSPHHVFNVDFTIEGDFAGLSAGIRRGLYRVCQEALANAARYAGVDAARVYLCVEAQEVSLSIRDKGRGFDPKMALAREHNREKFGLRGMCERVEALGGKCDILSQIGHGTQILVHVPRS